MELTREEFERVYQAIKPHLNDPAYRALNRLDDRLKYVGSLIRQVKHEAAAPDLR